MITPPVRPGSSRPSAYPLLFAYVFCAFGLLAGAMLVHQLSRAFAWHPILFLFMFAIVFGGIGIAAVTAPLGALRRPASAALIAPERGAYLFAGIFACWWNLLAFALALFALVRGAHLALLLPLAAGLALAWQAWRLYQRRWPAGAALLERLDAEAPRFRARIHLRPGLPIGVELRQMQHTKSGKSHSFSCAWKQGLGEFALAPGAAWFDIDAPAPAWRRATDSAWPAHWEVILRAPGRRIVFLLAP